MATGLEIGVVMVSVGTEAWAESDESEIQTLLVYRTVPGCVFETEPDEVAAGFV